MRKWFKGYAHDSGCVDFQTKSSLYEVKSCKLYLKCSNGNSSRAYKTKPHKVVDTTQMGRFKIDTENHFLLQAKGILENKIPKYVFVIVAGSQKIWCVKSWGYVDICINPCKEFNIVRIRDIWTEV